MRNCSFPALCALGLVLIGCFDQASPSSTAEGGPDAAEQMPDGMLPSDRWSDAAVADPPDVGWIPVADMAVGPDADVPPDADLLPDALVEPDAEPESVECPDDPLELFPDGVPLPESDIGDPVAGGDAVRRSMAVRVVGDTIVTQAIGREPRAGEFFHEDVTMRPFETNDVGADVFRVIGSLAAEDMEDPVYGPNGPIFVDAQRLGDYVLVVVRAYVPVDGMPPSRLEWYLVDPRAERVLSSGWLPERFSSHSVKTNLMAADGNLFLFVEGREFDVWGYRWSLAPGSDRPNVERFMRLDDESVYRRFEQVLADVAVTLEAPYIVSRSSIEWVPGQDGRAGVFRLFWRAGYEMEYDEDIVYSTATGVFDFPIQQGISTPLELEATPIIRSREPGQTHSYYWFHVHAQADHVLTTWELEACPVPLNSISICDDSVSRSWRWRVDAADDLQDFDPRVGDSFEMMGETPWLLDAQLVRRSSGWHIAYLYHSGSSLRGGAGVASLWLGLYSLDDQSTQHLMLGDATDDAHGLSQCGPHWSFRGGYMGIDAAGRVRLVSSLEYFDALANAQFIPAVDSLRLFQVQILDDDSLERASVPDAR